MATELLRERYRDSVAGGWLGRAAGATMGADLRGQEGPHTVSALDPGRGQAAASESLDAMLVSLAALEQFGAELDAFHLARAWARSIRYDVRAYGCALHNIRRGLLPPTSGSFDNWFSGDASAMARSLVWGLVAPASPQAAAMMAYADATVDHAAEGVWAAVFWAACASAAFVRGTPDALLKVGLAMVPPDSRVARLVQLARKSRVEQADIYATRALLRTEAGVVEPMDAALCTGYVAAALLYSHLSADTARWAVNCGGDSEAAGAVAGGLLGIVSGATGLPAEWRTGIGQYVVLGWGVPDVALPGTYGDLAARSLTVAATLQAAGMLDVAIVDQLTVIAPPPPAPVAVVEPATAPADPEAATPPEAAAPESGDSVPAGEPATEPSGPPPDAGATAAALPGPAAEPGTSLPNGITSTPGLKAEPAVAGPTVTEVATEPGALTSAPEQASDGALATDAAAPAGDTTAGVDAASQPAPDVAEPPAADAGDLWDPPLEQRIKPDGPAAVVASEQPAPHLEVVPAPVVPAAPVLDLAANDRIRPLWDQGWSISTISSGHFEAIIDYGDHGPAVVPGTPQSVLVTLRNRGDAPWLGTVHLGAPEGWQVAVPGAQGERQMVVPGGKVRLGYAVRAPENVPLPGANSLSLNLATEPGDEVSLPLALMAGSCWWWVGPFANVGDEGFYRSLEAERQPDLARTYLGRSKGLIGWTRMAFRGTVMDLEPVMSGRPGVAYGQAILQSTRPTTVRLVVATNDGARLWVNGAQVQQVHSHVPFCPERGQKRGVLVALRPGSNSVMLKVIRCDAPLLVSFAITNEDGTPRDDVRCVW